MDLFGTNFLRLRNDYVIPLINDGITRKKHEYWLLKDILTQNIISLNTISKNKIDIEISKGDFYKSLHCDIELFLNKSHIQYSDALKSICQSPTWSYVSFYYFSFFCSTTLSRFLHRGYIFLNSIQIKRIEDYSLAVYSSLISLDSGNYYFSTKVNASDNIIVSLNFTKGNVHKLSWIHTEQILRESLPFCDNYEKTIYKALLKLFSSFNSEFPSTLRNSLNYNGQSSIIDIEKTIPYSDYIAANNNFLRGVLTLDLNKTNANEITGTTYISVFIFKMINQLYNEYSARSNFGADFKKERELFLRDNKLTIPEE